MKNLPFIVALLLLAVGWSEASSRRVALPPTVQAKALQPTGLVVEDSTIVPARTIVAQAVKPVVPVGGVAGREYYNGPQAWYGPRFPVARAAGRVITWPVRAWLNWAPLRRLFFGRC